MDVWKGGKYIYKPRHHGTMDRCDGYLKWFVVNWLKLANMQNHSCGYLKAIKSWDEEGKVVRENKPQGFTFKTRDVND